MPLRTPPVIAWANAWVFRLLPIFLKAAWTVLFRPHRLHSMSSLPLDSANFGSTWLDMFSPIQGEKNAAPLTAPPELSQTAVATVFSPIVMPMPRHFTLRICGFDASLIHWVGAITGVATVTPSVDIRFAIPATSPSEACLDGRYTFGVK